MTAGIIIVRLNLQRVHIISELRGELFCISEELFASFPNLCTQEEAMVQ